MNKIEAYEDIEENLHRYAGDVKDANEKIARRNALKKIENLPLPVVGDKQVYGTRNAQFVLDNREEIERIFSVFDRESKGEKVQ